MLKLETLTPRTPGNVFFSNPDAPLEIPFRVSSGACSGEVLGLLFPLVWFYLSVFLDPCAVRSVCFRGLLTFGLYPLTVVDV